MDFKQKYCKIIEFGKWLEYHFLYYHIQYISPKTIVVYHNIMVHNHNIINCKFKKNFNHIPKNKFYQQQWIFHLLIINKKIWYDIYLFTIEKTIISSIKVNSIIWKLKIWVKNFYIINTIIFWVCILRRRMCIWINGWSCVYKIKKTCTNDLKIISDG